MRTWTRNPEEKRALILAAAKRLFFAMGYAAAQMPAIAKSAELSAGLIYRFFESKQHLVNVLFRTLKANFRATLFAQVTPAGKPQQQFDAFVDGVLQFALADPIGFLFLETHYHEPYLDDESRALDARLRSDVADWVTTLAKQGIIVTVDAHALVAAVLGQLVYLVRGHHERRFTLDRTTIEAFKDMTWRMICRPP